MSLEELKAAAVAMLDRAYIPYSHFPVGAALECADGTVFTGCNIENAVYPVGTCAERTAMVKAVSMGHTEFTAIAVVSDSDKPVSPCAFCRQYLVDFDPDIQVIMANAAGTDVVEMTASELLPMAFMGSGRDK